MSPDQLQAKVLFLDWLLALDHDCDPAVAAMARLTELHRVTEASAAQSAFCGLLSQVTAFAPPAHPRRRRKPPLT